MKREELEEKIKNGESVWVVSLGNVWEIKPTIKDLQILPTFKDIYKTKAEAEHYLNHADVERVEKLPFITWEEFLKGIQLKFIACDGVSNMTLYYCDNTIYLVDDEYPEFNTTSWELTEEKFYKAYDECKKLFLGEL